MEKVNIIDSRKEKAFFLIDLYFDHLNDTEKEEMTNRLLQEDDDKWDDFIIDEGKKYYELHDDQEAYGWLFVAAALWILFLELCAVFGLI